MYVLTLLGGNFAAPGITPGDLQGVGGIVAFILGAVVLFLYRRSQIESDAHLKALCTAWEGQKHDLQVTWDRERAELIGQRNVAIEQRDQLTATFHDFVRADKANALEALKTSNQIAEDLLVKTEGQTKRIEQLERDLEWERRTRGQ